MIDLGPRGSRGALLGPDPPGHRRAHGHRAAAAARPEHVPRVRDGRSTDARGYWTRAAARSSGARSTASRGRRRAPPPARQPTRRLSGVVDLATDPARPLARFAAVSDFRDFYTAGYSLADPRARPSGWVAGGRSARARRPTTSSTLLARAGLRPGSLVEIGCGDGALLAELAARGARAGARRLRALPARGRDRARAVGVARRVEVFDGARRARRRTAPTTSRSLSHVLEHVPEPMPLLREAARVAPAVLRRGAAGGQPLRPPRRRSARRRRGSGTSSSSTARRSTRWSAVAGLTIAAELSDPLPYAHHAFFAETRGERATRGAEDAACAARRGASCPAPAERVFTVHYACLR